VPGQDLSVKGNKMYHSGFKKVVVGKNVTNDWMKAREKLVKVKW
jgi:hypothetical protein